MEITKKIINYFFSYLLPAIFALVFTIWINSMPKILIALNKCSLHNLTCNVLFYSVIFIVAYFSFAVLIGCVWEAIKKLRIAIPKFIKTLNSRNLKICPGSLQDNIFTFKFITTEWRYFFKRTTAFIEIAPFDEPYTGHPGDKFEWRKPACAILNPKRFIPYDINFLEVDPEKNWFWIKTIKNNKYKFSPEKFGFEIKAHLLIFPTDNVNAIFEIKEIYLLVDYKGDKTISVKIGSKQEYEKYIWYREEAKTKIILN